MTYQAVHESLTKTDAATHLALEVPQLLADEAPGVYTRKVLEQIQVALGELTKTRETLVCEAATAKLLTRRQLAEATGLDLSTVQRWATRTNE